MELKLENLEKIDEILKKIDELDLKVSGQKRWLNVNETATYLGYSKDHIHKLKNSEFLEGTHYYKQSGKLLFDKVMLDSWVKQNGNHIDVIKIVNEVLDGIQ